MSKNSLFYAYFRSIFKLKFTPLLFEVILGIFLLAFFIQVYYHLHYFLKLATYKFPEMKNSGNVPLSVIVSAHNEIENLVNLIPALLHQEYPEYEVIIVDDRSKDGTYDFLKEQCAKIKNLKYIRVNETPEYMSPKKYALTLAIKAAQYEHLLFTDADCTPTSNQWIKQMESGFILGKDIVLGYSQYEKHPGFLNLFIRFETFFTAIQYLSYALGKKPYMGVGRNLAYKKSVFFANKGYHPFVKVLSGDDDLFINSVATKDNTNICIHQDGQTTSIPKTTFKSWYLQKKRHLSVGKFYKKSSKNLIGTLHVSTALFYITFPILCFQENFMLIALITYSLRFIMSISLNFMIAKKLKEKIEIYLFPILEIVYLIYYIVIGIISYRSRKIRWN